MSGVDGRVREKEVEFECRSNNNSLAIGGMCVVCVQIPSRLCGLVVDITGKPYFCHYPVWSNRVSTWRRREPTVVQFPHNSEFTFVIQR